MAEKYDLDRFNAGPSLSDATVIAMSNLVVAERITALMRLLEGGASTYNQGDGEFAVLFSKRGRDELFERGEMDVALRKELIRRGAIEP